MNTTPQDGVALSQSVSRAVGGTDLVDVVLCPPFPSLIAVYGVVKNSHVMLGAQNVSHHEHGAYTGEVSADMLQDLVSHVIVGHSERREYYGETDDVVSAKASAVIRSGMMAIVCVGEDEEERTRRRAERFVRRQVRSGVGEIEDTSRIVIAYEPIWAIGTGAAATVGQIEYITASIREELSEIYGDESAETIRVLYGGSTNVGNIRQIVQSSIVDGALVGSASLKAAEFSSMVSIMSDVVTAV